MPRSRRLAGEHILHQVLEPGRFPREVAHEPFLLFRRVVALESQRVEEEPELRQRRAQFVRYAGHEFAAQSREFALPAQLRGRERGGHDAQQADEQQERKWCAGKTAGEERRGGGRNEGEARNEPARCGPASCR